MIVNVVLYGLLCLLLEFWSLPCLWLRWWAACSEATPTGSRPELEEWRKNPWMFTCIVLHIQWFLSQLAIMCDNNNYTLIFGYEEVKKIFKIFCIFTYNCRLWLHTWTSIHNIIIHAWSSVCFLHLTMLSILLSTLRVDSLHYMLLPSAQIIWRYIECWLPQEQEQML